MIPKSNSYALVVGRVVIARGTKKQIHALRKKTPNSGVWLTSQAIGGTVG